MSRLHTVSLELAYGRVPVVQSLTVSIPDGQVTAIIGPNGCGKSTLLRALARLMKPRGGAALLDGQAIHRQATKTVARQLGLLPQNPIAPEAVTVEDLVRRGRFPHQSFFQPPSDRDRAAVDRALSLAGIEELRGRSVDELSGGQRQRAWIALVLAQETPLLLLDEPTTYLDIAHQHEVLDLVRRLNREEGKTVVMVLHDVNEAARACDHVIAMRDGAVVATGTPDEVITPALLRDVFAVESDVIAHPAAGHPVCVPRVHAGGDGPAANAPAALSVEAVTLGYGGRVVSEDLTVRFPAGAVTAIIGANACGKSTLLRALARQLTPSAGDVRLGASSAARFKRRDLARRLGLLTQAPAPPPGLTVAQLVASGRFPHQRWYRQWSAADAEAVQSALAATGMEPLAERAVEALSGGQRQRAFIALALAQDTPVLLLDEPTTFLDIGHQVEVLDLIRRLNHEQSRTVVMVLHDLHHACRYADHLVAMKDGEVRAEGPPADVITPALIADVFGLACDVLPDPLSGRPLVIPLATPSEQPEMAAVSA
jgi:iron complex transport system ATP-binding protein